MTMRRILLVLSLLVSVPALAQYADPVWVEQTAVDTFLSAAPEWQARVLQDETQRLCSIRRNDPTPIEIGRIQVRERKSIKFPEDDEVMGDWRKGEAIAQSGVGNQFSDAPGTVSGGNCYACHQLAGKELSFGTIGPSLLNYGRLRNYDPKAARVAFGKIYNAQASVACSLMPRFGRNRVLSEEQIKDVVAYLFSRDSPVNRR